MRRAWPWILLAALLVLAMWELRSTRPPRTPRPTASPIPSAAAPGGSTATPLAEFVQVVAAGLEVPWALAFAPDGTLYATERPGRLVRIRDGKPDVVATLPDVSQQQESGLLGLALDPAFAENGRLYLYYTSRRDVNRVVRYRLSDGGLAEERVLLDNIPAAPFHDGGRVKFGPDGLLYVTTGDAARPALAQDTASLAGKILRIGADGQIPPDNPFPNSPVYTLGHRNPQGLAWDADGELYLTEHGPSGQPPDCCHDEINLLGALELDHSRNYGWHFCAGAGRYVYGPKTETAVCGTDQVNGPLTESGPTDTWAPAGAAVVGHTLVFAGLRGRALFTLDLDHAERGVTTRFEEQFGRLRDVVRGPDGFLYVTTSNRDGRGTPGPDDDRILRIHPRAFAR